ncbi:MAG: helix-turn-helix transcriptional regulator [Sutterella wadsworthensis]|nr:helix-turn-helix transcriptional regulator [Sutterella wadsworthensis]
MQNLTQEALSKKSGVSLGTIRRFEQTGDISMKHLVLLAMYLNIVQEMEGLFKVQLIQDLYVKTPKLRKRAR